MNESKAKEHLRTMLVSFTAGTVLHLLAGVIRADAREADDTLAIERGVAVEATMPAKRPAKQVPGEIEPAAVSVTDMATRCQLSRSRFSALVLAGVFPKPLREAGRRPYYPPTSSGSASTSASPGSGRRARW